MKNDHKLVILIGSPGSGKGTQAHLLEQKKKMLHLEASKLLEKKFLSPHQEDIIETKNGRYSLDQQKKLWSDGHLCEDGFVAAVIEEGVEKIKRGVDLILLDGFPRSLKQSELAVPFLLSFYDPRDILVLALEVSEEESLKRNSSRRVCSLMRHSIIAHPETEALTICPVDGSLLERRVLDSKETIIVRLQEFKRLTAPVVDYFENKGVRVARINGSGTISDVFDKVIKEVNDFGV